MKKLDFEKTLLEAVDHALLSLGESPRKAVYNHLDKSFRLQREEIQGDLQSTRRKRRRPVAIERILQPRDHWPQRDIR